MMINEKEKYTLFSLGRSSRSWIFLKIVFGLLVVITTLVVVEQIAKVIYLASKNELTQVLLFDIMSILGLAAILRFFFIWLSHKGVFEISARIKADLREKLYSKILDLELGYRDVKKTGGIVTTAVEGVENLETFFGLFIPQIFLAVLIPITLFFYLFEYSTSIAVVLLLAVPLIPLSVGLVQAWVRRVAKMHWSTLEELSNFYLDSIQGITTLKNYGLTKRRAEEINQVNWDFRNATMRLLYANLASILVMDVIAMLGTALGIALSVLYFNSGKITLFSAIIVLLLSYEFFRPLRTLGSYFHSALNGISASKSILEILNTESKRKKPEVFKTFDLSNNNTDIVFSDVQFSYGNNRNLILDNINFVAKTGQITAIVGRSGSGKTTIANLIVKFIDPMLGRITIGANNLYNINPNEVRKQISMVSQTTYLFHGTIRENLLIAQSEATDEELLEACRKAGIEDFITSLPNKLDSFLVERGKNLSSGQIQRIAIARALLKDTPILILDEPTSNVDAENEGKIQRTLKRIAKEKTTIIIAHRLSTIQDADKILVLERGKIVEEGTHEDLMAKNNLYTRLVSDQLTFESNRVKEKTTGG